MNANVSKFVVVRWVVIREHWAPEAAGSVDKIRSGQRGSLAAMVLLRGEPQPSLPGAGAFGLSPALHPARGAESFPWEIRGCRGVKSQTKVKWLHFTQYPQVAVRLLSFRLFGFLFSESGGVISMLEACFTTFLANPFG